MKSRRIKVKGYFGVWAALLFLLLLTWGLAQWNLGAWNTPAALGIAFGKALLVVLFFMHVRYESKLVWVFVAAGLLWFGIMVDLTLTDYLSRGEIRGTRQSWVHPESPAR